MQRQDDSLSIMPNSIKTGWDDDSEVEDRRRRPASKAQRQAVHINVCKLNNNPDIVSALTVGEADSLIKIFMAVQQRAKEQQQTQPNVMPICRDEYK